MRNTDAIKIYLLLLAVFFGSDSYCLNQHDSILNLLDNELERSSEYVALKTERIQQLKQDLNEEQNAHSSIRILLEIANEYDSYQYDSAFRYASILSREAFELSDERWVFISRTKLAFILLSAGMYKEAADTLSTFHGGDIQSDILNDYYRVSALLYFSLSDLLDSHYHPIYDSIAFQYVDSLLKISYPSSYDYLYFKALRDVRTGEFESALTAFQRLRNSQNLSLHQRAIVNSTMSDIFINRGEKGRAIFLLAEAAVFDIKSATKETAALLNLANLLYQESDIQRAYRYTNIAMRDANFYGARHRKIQAGSILPVIVEEQMSIVEGQRKELLWYSMIATLLVVFIIISIIIILLQLKRLKRADKELKKTNSSLEKTNKSLLEANRIKEEYIGYYFNQTTNYILKLEKIKSSIEKDQDSGTSSVIRQVSDSINIKKERQRLYKGFDEVFLSLFPDFVSQFNALLKDEYRIELAEDELLNTDLRIYALIRLGINENDKIARILDFSVNTIYTYKTKIKNRAKVANEEFDDRIMKIRVF